MNTITITIDGPNKSGKSLIAARIAHLLGRYKYEVTISNDDAHIKPITGAADAVLHKIGPNTTVIILDGSQDGAESKRYE